jgi:hypothetical protein
MTLEQIIQDVPAYGTLVLAIVIAVKANRIHAATDIIQAKTEELVIHTNSLTDKLMEKTDVLARAEGVKEGQAMAPTLNATNLSDAMAKAVLAAAEFAAEKVLAAAALAREAKKE